MQIATLLFQALTHENLHVGQTCCLVLTFAMLFVFSVSLDDELMFQSVLPLGEI